jgi:hypothetical protein
MKWLTLLCVLLLPLLVLPAPAREEKQSDDEKALKEDLRNLQGKWEYTFKEGEANAGIRKVKEIKDNKETVTWYNPEGKVFLVNEVDFKLERKGKLRIFSWSNGKVVEGELKGSPFEDGSFLYELEGDEWRELLPVGDGKIVWKRVKEKK